MHKNVAVRIIVLSKLYIAPAQGYEFALAQPSAQRRQEERVLIGVVRFHRLQEGVYLLWSQGGRFVFGLLSLHEPTKFPSRVRTDEPVLDGSIQDNTQRRDGRP